MPIRHTLLALLVITIWAINFIFVERALTELPPFLLCTIRFVLASVPLIFFIKRPAMPFKMLLAYGLLMFDMQFGFIFYGMKVGMPAGLASLLMQVQIFFSMLLAAIFLGERPSPHQIFGAVISFAGISVVALHLDSTVTLLGFLLVLASAFCWGAPNIIIRKNNKVNMIALVVWGSFIAIFPMLILSLCVDGPQRIASSFHHITWVGITSILYITYGATWLGYGLWNWLIARHPVSAVVPFTLLIPVIGMVSSVFLLDESFPVWKLVACVLVIGGLVINLLGTRIVKSISAKYAT